MRGGRGRQDEVDGGKEMKRRPISLRARKSTTMARLLVPSLRAGKLLIKAKTPKVTNKCCVSRLKVATLSCSGVVSLCVMSFPRVGRPIFQRSEIKSSKRESGGSVSVSPLCSPAPEMTAVYVSVGAKPLQQLWWPICGRTLLEQLWRTPMSRANDGDERCEEGDEREVQEKKQKLLKSGEERTEFTRISKQTRVVYGERKNSRTNGENDECEAS